MGRWWRSVALVVTALALATAAGVAVTVVRGVRGSSAQASCGPSYAASVLSWDRRRDAVFAAAHGPTVAAFLGDSYTAGVPLRRLDEGYAVRAARRLGFRPWLAGRGGTGYLNAGPCGGATYADRLGDALRPRPSVVVVQGGVNDWRSATGPAIGRAALALYREARAAAPAARVVVVGPSLVPSVPARAVEAVDAALRAAATTAGVTYVSGLRWLTAPGLTAPDALHPSLAGHSVMADRLAAALRAAGVGGQ